MKNRLPAAGLPWPIRAVQLDVARHMESVASIERYAEFAARQGFNTLVLYLEGRIRTRTFPYRPKAESYTLADMAKVAAHARSVGLDVVPVVSTLGHAEHFLRCKELFRLAEERDGRGRFGTEPPQVFCPSEEGTYAFFEAYFRELAEVFTGPHWHVGLDESWNLGYCDRCRARWAKEGLGGLFRAHVERVAGIVRKLGKRMWMWDDFYELFPEELEKAPRDVVQCHWGYDSLVELEGQLAHFTNRWRHNWLADYERLGIDAIACPANSYWNIQTFTDYARRYRLLGGLLTQWEGTPRFWPGNAAVVAFGGRLWNAREYDPERAWQAATRDVLPGARPGLVRAVRELVRLPKGGHGSRSGVQSRWANADTTQRAAVRMALDLLRAERAVQPEAGPADFLDDLDYAASAALLGWDLRELELAILDPRRPAADAARLGDALKACRAELERLSRYWDRCYARAAEPGNPSDPRYQHAWEGQEKRLAALERALRKPPTSRSWMLVLRLFLQDFYGAPTVKVAVLSGKKELVLATGSLKPDALVGERNGGAYDVQLPFAWACRPDAVRLEGGGYGGQGVAFAQLVSPSATLLPVSLRAVSGPVRDAEAVLRDDSSSAFLGHADIRAAVHAPELAAQRGVLEIGMGSA